MFFIMCTVTSATVLICEENKSNNCFIASVNRPSEERNVYECARVRVRVSECASVRARESACIFHLL